MDDEVNINRDMENSFINDLKKNPFLVPDNYFDQLFDQNISNKNLEELKSINAFKVKEGYFEDLSAKILTEVNITNKSELANKFDVPENYFENLTNKILAQTTEEKTVVNQKKSAKIFKLSAIKYAAAAAILIATSFGIYFNHQHNSNFDNKLANLSDEEITTYLQMYPESTDMYSLVEDTYSEDLSLIEMDLEQ